MSNLHIAEAVPLGYALVARVASDVGVRALCIKGPLTSELGLRPPSHVSQDVDAWLDPPEVEAFVEAMLKCGWSRVPLTRGAVISAPHSIQLRHPGFGLEIDVHHRFPGFLRDPQEVFDLLWARRRRWSIAGAPAWATDEEATFLVELLHLARDPAQRRSRLRVALASPIVLQESFLRLVDDSGAAAALGPYLDRYQEAADEKEFEAWSRRVALGRTAVVPALDELQRTPVIERPAVVWRLIWLPGEEVLEQYPSLRGKPFGLARARLRRWIRAARQLPRARRIMKATRGKPTSLRS